MGEVVRELRARIVRKLTEEDLKTLPQGWADFPTLQTQQNELTVFGTQLARKQDKGAKSATEFSRTKSRSGIVPSLDNAKLAIQQLRITPKLDVFRQRIVIDGYTGPIGETLDDVELKLRNFIMERLEFDPETRHTRDAVRILAMQNSFDPVREYLDALEWDGERRLDFWMSRYLGADDDELTRAMGRATLIAGVRRVRRPGSKFDSVLVLEGPQGGGKSGALKVLAGSEELFTDEIVLGESYKEQQELLRGKWIVELPELAGLNNSEVRRTKQFITKTHDRARGAWARTVEDSPRRCIMIGTTNDDTYLKDTTGNRRFWPVRVGRIDLAGLREVRDQLWAEAAAAEPGAGEPVTIPNNLWTAAEVRQAQRVAADPWEDLLEAALALPHNAWEASGERRTTTQVIFVNVLKREMHETTLRDTRRLGECMKRLGWTGPKSIWHEGGPVKGYVKKIE